MPRPWKSGSFITSAMSFSTIVRCAVMLASLKKQNDLLRNLSKRPGKEIYFSILATSNIQDCFLYALLRSGVKRGQRFPSTGNFCMFSTRETQFWNSEANLACIYVSARSVKSSPFCIKILWGLAEAIVSHTFIPATLKFLYPIFEYTKQSVICN